MEVIIEGIEEYIDQQVEKRLKEFFSQESKKPEIQRSR